MGVWEIEIDIWNRTKKIEKNHPVLLKPGNIWKWIRAIKCNGKRINYLEPLGEISNCLLKVWLVEGGSHQTKHRGQGLSQLLPSDHISKFYLIQGQNNKYSICYEIREKKYKCIGIKYTTSQDYNFSFLHLNKSDKSLPKHFFSVTLEFNMLGAGLTYLAIKTLTQKNLWLRT